MIGLDNTALGSGLCHIVVIVIIFYDFASHLHQHTSRNYDWNTFLVLSNMEMREKTNKMSAKLLSIKPKFSGYNMYGYIVLTTPVLCAQINIK